MVVDPRAEEGELVARRDVPSGELLEVNRKAVDEPETVNADPYGEGWLIRIRLSEPAEADVLFDAGAYRAFLAEQ